MGLFDGFKKKFENVGSSKKVKHVIDEKKKKPAKKEKKDGGLTHEEIAGAQAMEKQEKPGNKAAVEEPKKSKKDAVKAPRDTKYAFRILLKPLVTEKSAYLTSERTYMFAVHPDATKNEIAKAIYAAYDVKPTSVRLENRRGKEITYGRISGKTRRTRKAFVKLPEGKTIDIYQS
jgi:large subunit ribosomal protein L23